jgi:DNA-binding transcriptional regulator YiaG
MEDRTMAGRYAFEQLRAGLSADSQRKAAALTDAMEQELSLAELRRARAMTQEQLASDLHVGQASIAKLERRTDVHLSTLRRFVEAMGGELDIVVRFPDQPQVRLRGIVELADGGGTAGSG